MGHSKCINFFNVIGTDATPFKTVVDPDFWKTCIDSTFHQILLGFAFNCHYVRPDVFTAVIAGESGIYRYSIKEALSKNYPLFNNKVKYGIFFHPIENFGSALLSVADIERNFTTLGTSIMYVRSMWRNHARKMLTPHEAISVIRGKPS